MDINSIKSCPIIKNQIITNDVGNKEYFNPRKIDISKLLKANDNLKIFKGGSSAFFDKYEDYNPHDYDYIILCKTNEPLEYDILMYSYKGFVDFFEYFYLENWTKEEIIEFFIKCSQLYLSNNIYMYRYAILPLLNKSILDFFNITYNDIEKYLETIYQIIINNKFPLRNHYYIKIIKYYIENKSLELTKEQLDDCYLIYKKYRDPNYINNRYQEKHKRLMARLNINKGENF